MKCWREKILTLILTKFSYPSICSLITFNLEDPIIRKISLSLTTLKQSQDCFSLSVEIFSDRHAA